MKGFWIALGAMAVVLIFAVFSIFMAYKTTYDTLNIKQQNVNAAKSNYSAALETIPQKIEGVWAMAQQYMDHESKTFTDVAALRSGALQAVEQFKQATLSDADMSKLNMLAGQTMQRLNEAALAINLQFERYPELRASETTQRAMVTLEEGVNEVKTALDDWISSIKNYNTYRGELIVGIFANFMSKYPLSYEYFESDTKKLDINSLNPVKK